MLVYFSMKICSANSPFSFTASRCLACAHRSPRPRVPRAYPMIGVAAVAPVGAMTVALTLSGFPVAEVEW